MYEQYWGLKSSPFQENLRDIDWLDTSPPHQEALARLYYLIEHGRRLGLVMGPPGSGKTLLLNALVDAAKRSQREVTLIDLIGMNRHEMLWQLAASLKLGPSESEQQWTLWRNLEDHLQAIQMAQAMSVVAFDHLERAHSDCIAALQRLLHLEKQAPCCTTFVVSGRSGSSVSVAESLAGMSDLRIDLAPFTREETAGYISRRLEQAGCERKLFEVTAIDLIFRFTKGITRDINRLCDLSLLAAMAEGREWIDGDLVETAAAEVPENTEAMKQSDPLRELAY